MQRLPVAVVGAPVTWAPSWFGSSFATRTSSSTALYAQRARRPRSRRATSRSSPACFDAKYEAFDADAVARDCQVAFLALPHGESARVGQGSSTTAASPCSICRPISGCARPRPTPQWYGAARRARAPAARASTAWSSAIATRCAGARLVAVPGCYPTATILALAPLLDRAPGPRRRPHRRRQERRLGRRARAPTLDPLRRGRRRRARLQGRGASPHARDRAGAGARCRAAGALDLHAAPRADGARHPRHGLRAADRSVAPSAGLRRRRCARAYGGEPFVTVVDHPPDTAHCAARTASTSPPGTTRAPAASSSAAPSTTSSRAPPARRCSASTSCAAGTRSAGLDGAAIFP